MNAITTGGRVIGRVSRVVGPLVQARGVKDAQMLELAEVGADRLVGEIVRLDGERAALQVYEDTTGLKPGEPIYGTGMPLSAELGPGLLGGIFDGIQRPLAAIRDAGGQYIRRGIHLPVLDRERTWPVAPRLRAGDPVRAGAVIAAVQETGSIEHRVLAPPGAEGRITSIAPEGEYRLNDTIAVISGPGGERAVTLCRRWPVRRGLPYARKMPPAAVLATGQRVIDTLFPVAKGGTVVLPGGFGTGKTMLQHALAKWCDAQVIVFIGCGERGNEMTDVLTEFPKLLDPRTGRPLMERTILIANTSNMPVAAREASIYTGITLAEYYRDMGYHVAVMADSTSRWAEALRELSGRLEELPADEGFPSYLPTRLAEFYERGGAVTTLGGEEGSVTVIGSVSPPGGDFSEPVTQHSKRFVRALWLLDRKLANARHYPAVSWIDSYSEYVEELAPWWEAQGFPQWRELRAEIMGLLQQENRLQQVVKLVGPDVLPDSQRIVLETCALFKNSFLQQDAFSARDAYTPAEKQMKMLSLILRFHRLGSRALQKGATLVAVRGLPSYREMMRMRQTVPNDDLSALDRMGEELERSIAELEARYGRR
ncbi:MAG: V-type ATP synthase subunit A [Candidatus Aureabacteria bacterium]|nr:V-type ATP synthase subunit A [Candidatus Auribacterota bacterium]NLW94894.1 V-type ATP synthase subunit A [Chlamydiota bacterium]HOE27498.1 V-type ATP synthase subunit A [bacterium]HQM52098.1 V-type ATP synthase subunit A [bacterium]